MRVHNMGASEVVSAEPSSVPTEATLNARGEK